MAIVKYLGCKEVLIREDKKEKAGFFEIIPEVKNQDYINHHILLADVSGSMTASIKTLKERIITTLKALLKIQNSYVSVITYSGHNQSKRIINGVKCEEISYQMADVWNVIEEELYIKSVTVMSEPLEQSIEICKTISSICNKHHIALFTDGCLVPGRWDEETEREKCFKIAEICNKEGIFLNAVGFGQYYDRSFLKELVEISGSGTLIHIDQVKDYSDVILDIISKVNSERIVSADISTSEGTIFNISNSTMKNQIRTRSINNDGNLYAVISSNSLKVDSESYSVQFDKELNDLEVLDSFYYSLARYYLKEEDIDNMEFIVKALGDTALFKMIQNCYSFIEKGNAINKITEVLDNKAKRFAEGRYPIVETGKEKLCILEILLGIIEDKDSELYWDVNTPYNRITQNIKQIEDNIVFRRQENGLLPVTNISIGSEKLNVGIKVRIPGEVIDSVSGLRKDACIYRDYNLVNSGNVNVPYINARLSKDLYDRFSEEGVIVKTGLYSYIPDHIYTINLQGIKSTNKRVLKSMTMSEIAGDLYEVRELKCKQWAINQIIKDITNKTDKLTFTDMSLEEQEIRRILRIDENGIYSPISREKDNDSMFEIYPAVFMTWDIVKFPEKNTKDSYLNNIGNSVTDMKCSMGKSDKDIYQFLSQELLNVRMEMRRKEFRINSVRIASAITNKSPFLWEESGEKAKTANDNVLNRNMVVGGKLNYSKKTIDDKVIEQKKWVQFIKCN